VRAQALLKQQRVVPRQQDGGGARSHDQRFVVRRVELAKVFDAHLGQLGHQRHVDVALERDAVEEGVVTYGGQSDAQALRIADQVFDGLQLWHVVARFVGHAQVEEAGAQASGAVGADGALHVAVAPVVGRQRQLPVAKHAVQALEVVERGVGRGEHVAPVVAKGVLHQVEGAPGGGHELP